MQSLELAIVFVGLTSMIAVPLGVIIGLPLLAWFARAWLRLQERKLEVERSVAASRVRALAGERVPEWLDTRDPEAILAWARAERELMLLDRRAG